MKDIVLLLGLVALCITSVADLWMWEPSLAVLGAVVYAWAIVEVRDALGKRSESLASDCLER